MWLWINRSDENVWRRIQKKKQTKDSLFTSFAHNPSANMKNEKKIVHSASHNRSNWLFIKIALYMSNCQYAIARRLTDRSAYFRSFVIIYEIKGREKRHCRVLHTSSMSTYFDLYINFNSWKKSINVLSTITST